MLFGISHLTSLLSQGLRPLWHLCCPGRTGPSIASGGANPMAEQSQQGVTLCYPVYVHRYSKFWGWTNKHQLNRAQQIRVQLSYTYSQLRTTFTSSDCNSRAETQSTLFCTVRGNFRIPWQRAAPLWQMCALLLLLGLRNVGNQRSLARAHVQIHKTSKAIAAPPLLA